MDRSIRKGLAIVGALALSLGAAVTLGRAQAKKAEAPAPAKPEWEETLESWNAIGGKLTAMAEDMPEAKYWYQPTKDVRTFGDMLLHVGGSNYDIVNAVAGRQLGKSENDPPRKEHNSKAAVVAYLKKSFADGASVLRGIKSHDAFEKPVKDPWGSGLSHPHSMWLKVIAHASEHYGSLVTYYRVQGLVPPESRPKK